MVTVGVGLLLVVVGWALAFTVPGALLIFAGMGTVVAGALRFFGLPRIVAVIVGLAVLIGLTVQMMNDVWPGLDWW